MNLNVSEAALLAADARDAANPSNRTFEVAWSNYVRWTFQKGQIYAFDTLRPGMFLYIAENKSLAGREGRAEGDAIGRLLTAAWFEQREEADEGCVIRRVDRTSKGLTTMLLTLAELLHAAGEPYPPLGAEATAREKEFAMEAKFPEVPRRCFESTHLWEEDDPWTFRLASPAPAERKYLQETPLDKLNNMALARLLEILKGTDRRASFAHTKSELFAAIAAP